MVPTVRPLGVRFRTTARDAFMPGPNTPITLTSMWWLVDVTGQDPALTPAINADQAQWTVQATLNATNSPHQAKKARQVTDSGEIDRWMTGYRQQLEDPNLPNPTAWRKALYETIRTQHLPDAPPTPLTPTWDARPITSRAPNMQDTALRATAHQLVNAAQPTIAAVLLIVWLTTLWNTLAGYSFPLFTATAIISILIAVVFGVQWLNRLDQPTTLNTMKWCQHCNTTVQQGHKHSRRRQRNYQDENERRRILHDYRNTVGEWCRGTEHCDPGGHNTTPDNPLTVDHTHPQSKGGTLADGYRVICRRANSARGNRPIGA